MDERRLQRRCGSSAAEVVSNELTEPSIHALVERIFKARDLGAGVDELIAEFERRVPYPNARELVVTDQSADYVATRAMGFERLPDTPERTTKLKNLVRKVRQLQGGECEVDIATDIIEASVPHPNVRTSPQGRARLGSADSGRLLGRASPIRRVFGGRWCVRRAAEPGVSAWLPVEHDREKVRGTDSTPNFGRNSGSVSVPGRPRIPR